ncbi:MAG: class I SAM-dependent methyltransferase [Limisphaerales bacterium]
MPPETQRRYDDAVAALLRQFSWNPWFVDTYWPENEPRVRLMVAKAVERFPGADAEVLDVGCGLGHITFVLARCGFRIRGTDAYEDKDRAALFQQAGIAYLPCNLNHPEPLPGLPPASFDLVLLGEVIEHILNHPLGLMRSLAGLLRPGGWLFLTTPNPSTAMNALRTLLDRHALWGTPEFMKHPKFDPVAGIIDRGEIHYREYRAGELRDLARDAGLTPGEAGFLMPANRRGERALKAAFKGLFRTSLGSTRVFGSDQYLLCQKPR